jgi:Fe-S-cluster containining protein
VNDGGPVERAAKVYEARAVAPHCSVCRNPCCKLQSVVLELDWPRAEKLYQIGVSRRAFDESLRDGTGPKHIKADGGRYYAHGAACPAYEETTGRCREYDSWVKPRACSDFPLYDDGGALTADLRCEALSIEELEETLREELGDVVITRDADPQFPFLVSLYVGRPARKGRKGR